MTWNHMDITYLNYYRWIINSIKITIVDGHKFNESELVCGGKYFSLAIMDPKFYIKPNNG